MIVQYPSTSCVCAPLRQPYDGKELSALISKPHRGDIFVGTHSKKSPSSVGAASNISRLRGCLGSANRPIKG